MIVTPNEAELTDALVDLKLRDPQLGISKIHALLLQHYPDWIVSEKRTRKILQANGLTNSTSTTTTTGGGGSSDEHQQRPSPLPPTVPRIPYIPKYTSKTYTPPPPGAPRAALPPLEFPTSRVIAKLDVSQWTAKVEVRWFGEKRGKGLVAVEEVDEGEIVWREDPWVVAPEWEVVDLQREGRACGYCTTMFGGGEGGSSSRLVIPCAGAAAGAAAAGGTGGCVCPMRFCNRLCLARSSKIHPLLCAAQNPASVPLMKYARDCHWMALNALAHVSSRVMLVNQHSEEAMRKDWEVVDSWAVLGMRERVKCSYLGSVSFNLCSKFSHFFFQLLE